MAEAQSFVYFSLFCLGGGSGSEVDPGLSLGEDENVQEKIGFLSKLESEIDYLLYLVVNLFRVSKTTLLEIISIMLIQVVYCNFKQKQ